MEDEWASGTVWRTRDVLGCIGNALDVLGDEHNGPGGNTLKMWGKA